MSAREGAAVEDDCADGHDFVQVVLPGTYPAIGYLACSRCGLRFEQREGAAVEGRPIDDLAVDRARRLLAHEDGYLEHSPLASSDARALVAEHDGRLAAEAESERYRTALEEIADGTFDDRFIGAAGRARQALTRPEDSPREGGGA